MRADEFRALDDIFAEDVRQSIDSRTLQQHHSSVAEYGLLPSVPESIATQYEVARNLYLHAWSVYRFYMVAQHQVLIVLEMAIREKFGRKALQKFAKQIGMRPGLAAHFRFLREYGWISNEDFPLWHHRRRINAEQRFGIEVIQKMQAEGLKEYSDDLDHIEVDQYPFDYDYIAVLERSLAPIRNEHAHGSKMLTAQVLGTFEIVSIVINRLFPAEEFDKCGKRNGEN